MTSLNSFNARDTLSVAGREYEVYRLDALEKAGVGHVDRLPFSLKILLENLLRREDGQGVPAGDIEKLAGWEPGSDPEEIQFMPARVLLQDLTGVPAVVDLAAMREAMRALGGDPHKISPLVRADLVIDHSVQVDAFGSDEAFAINARMEMQRNKERYALLRWARDAFDDFTVAPPDAGIVHQVNLEHLASVVFTPPAADGMMQAYPDTLLGLDSHTTMINGLGVLGWGVGGIEAEAAMLGQPVSMLIPEVTGFKLNGSLKEGTTATDLVLTVTQMLRQHGVVGKFVEFYGEGLEHLSLETQATISNMCPEYGATVGYFPVDKDALAYLRLTGRRPELVELVERYTKEQGIFHTGDTPDPVFSDTLELDLATVEPSIAGPRRPQDRVPLSQAKQSFRRELAEMLKSDDLADPNGDRVARWIDEGGNPATPATDQAGPFDKTVPVTMNGSTFDLTHGSIVIAAITSCTNTSNPSVMVRAGLVARNAVARGLAPKPWVKASLAPGSKVVIDYLEAAGLRDPLEKLGFYLVGYGCTTCIGNSGPLPEPVSEAVTEGDLVAAAVLSGNRNFEGRIHGEVRANYLASPPLVVAYALAGRMDVDLLNEPLGQGSDGQPVFLKDIWPADAEVAEAVGKLTTDMFDDYKTMYEGTDEWNALEIPTGDLFAWDPESTYIKLPPYFEDISLETAPLADIEQARVLAVFGDSLTTDHISPAGAIARSSAAAEYLMEHGVEYQDFNTYGARRGNHEIMMRGTFGNVRLRNQLVHGGEGPVTLKLPGGDQRRIYDAAMAYAEEGTPLIVIAGKEYGTGSSRDWAAKGPSLLGVRAVIAESIERIHRSNLIGMGILPLTFQDGENMESLGLTGREQYTISGIAAGLVPRQQLAVRATADGGATTDFTVTALIDTPIEVDYYRHGGILHYVLRQLAANGA